jgi:hypothetical protein
MRLSKHIIASGIISAGIYAFTNSVKMAAVSFASGVLLDLDHVVDYWLHDSFNLDLSRFFDICYTRSLSKTRFFLHSAELVVILAAAAFFTRSSLLTALVLGACQHLMFDQVLNDVYLGSYFFIYRWSNGFKAETVFPNVQVNNK